MGNVKLTFVYFNVAMLANLISLAARLRLKNGWKAAKSDGFFNQNYEFSLFQILKKETKIDTKAKKCQEIE